MMSLFVPALFLWMFGVPVSAPAEKVLPQVQPLVWSPLCYPKHSVVLMCTIIPSTTSALNRTLGPHELFLYLNAVCSSS